jgi:hypothetical protein
MTDVEHNRRFDDRDRALNTKIDQLERDYQILMQKVTLLEASVQVVKLEQTHLKELMDSRLKVIEKSQELQLVKMDQLSKEVIGMGNDVDKTPAGRTLQRSIEAVTTTVEAHTIALEKQTKVQTEIELWQKGIDSVIAILKWMGPVGIVALALTLLRMAKLIP